MSERVNEEGERATNSDFLRVSSTIHPMTTTTDTYSIYVHTNDHRHGCDDDDDESVNGKDDDVFSLFIYFRKNFTFENVI